MSDVALSTLFINPFGLFCVDLMSKSILDLIDDIDFSKRSQISDGYIMHISICMHISPF